MNALAKSDLDTIAKYEQSQPWAQMDTEDMTNFVMFNHYLNLGPGRTIDKAIEESGGCNRVPATWKSSYVKFSWRERSEAWDEYQIVLDRIDYENERKKWRGKRRDMLSDLHESALKAVEEIKNKLDHIDEHDDATLAQLIRLVQNSLAETRIEFGDTDTAPSTQINVDQRNQKVEVKIVEVRKDYERTPDVVRGEFERLSG